MAAKNDHILLQRDVNKAEHPSFCPCVEGTTKLAPAAPFAHQRLWEAGGRQRGTGAQCGAAAAQGKTGSWERQD